MQILVQGFGGIGYRHFQALLNVLKPSDRIVIIDPSEAAYDLFMNVASQDGRMEFFSDLCDSVGGHYDLVISATGASHRLNSLVKFNEICTASHVLLEKVVFSNYEDFRLLETVMGKKVDSFFVNHPYRYYPFYENIRKFIGSCEDFRVDVKVGNWGLLSNSLHKIDLCEYLFSTRVIEVNCSDLYPQLFESKRKGYLEANGKIKVRYANGGRLTIHHLEGVRDWEVNLSCEDFLIDINMTTKRMSVKEQGKNAILDYISVPPQRP